MNAYAAVLATHQPRPIRTPEQYEVALEAFEGMMSQYDENPSQELAEVMDLYAMTIQVYEATAHPLPEATPRAIVEHLIEEAGTSQAQLARELGVSRSQVANILSGQRSISREMSIKLGERFGVRPSLFLGVD